MKVAAVVVSHGHPRELEESLPMLREQVDELIVIANIPGSVPDGVEAVHNEQSLGFGANVNKGAALTSAELVLSANPDAVPQPGAVDALRDFMTEHSRCGVAGPRMLYPDGTPQPSRRRFPTVLGTIVRRTPLRLVVPQRRHFHLDEEQPSEPVEADWMLGGFLLLRRTMLDEIGGWDSGYRMYCEDIDLNYRAARAGWERWYVPAALVHHDYAAVIDKTFLSRHTIWHAKAMLRFLRKHPERLLALR